MKKMSIKCLGIVVLSVLLGCASALLSHPNVASDYSFNEPDVAIAYGRIAPAPIGKETYLTYGNETSADRPVHGDRNAYFVIRLKPGFYRLHLAASGNPLLNQGIHVVDESNGINENAIRYRFQPGKVYYLGNIQWKNGYFQVDSKKEQDDKWIGGQYSHFKSATTEAVESE